MKISRLLPTALLAVGAIASAQTGTTASDPKTRAEVKNDVKAARANGELPPDIGRSQIGDPPVPKARKPRKPKASAAKASAAQ